jgi:hypothetical protein
MFRVLRYIVMLRRKVRNLEDRVAQLEYKSNITPRGVNPHEFRCTTAASKRKGFWF